MTGELRNRAGKVFWSDACGNAVAAIKFALERIDDPYERSDFLVSWNEGDVADWPEFLASLDGDKPADDWIPWHGGMPPVGNRVRVDYKLRDGETDTYEAGKLRWGHRGYLGDIIAYRVVKP